MLSLQNDDSLVVNIILIAKGRNVMIVGGFVCNQLIKSAGGR